MVKTPPHGAMSCPPSGLRGVASRLVVRRRSVGQLHSPAPTWDVSTRLLSPQSRRMTASPARFQCASRPIDDRGILLGLRAGKLVQPRSALAANCCSHMHLCPSGPSPLAPAFPGRASVKGIIGDSRGSFSVALKFPPCLARAPPLRPLW